MAKFEIDRAATRRLMYSEDVDKGVKHFTDRLHQIADTEVPIGDTHRLILSGKVSPNNVGGYDLSYGDDPGEGPVNYAVYVHEGTRYQDANEWLTRAIGIASAIERSD